ncbi:CU044_5270 family protein [Amycolatopsis sp. NPDC051903]|uniref:CU044_5270 family protein n=1 Tax=Amycolatopsis sp. NPDC051903 TaxID=3363936 RepID=UPI0037B6868C
MADVQILSEDELDDALARLGPPLPFTRDVQERIRTQVGLERKRKPRRWFAAAAVVAVLAGGVSAVPLLADDVTPAASAAAARDLEQTAANAPAVAPGPGEFLYVSSRDSSIGSSTTRTGKPLTAVFDTETEVWLPADRQGDWLIRTTPGVPTRWLVGSADLARTEGDGGLLDPKALRPREERAPCGDFPTSNGEFGDEPSAHLVGDCSTDSGDWSHVTPRFIAELPTDPRQLYDRMVAGAGGHPGGVLGLAANVLRSGQAGRELRTALYRALVLVPGLDITSDVADLDGRRGIGLGLAQGTLRQELVVDPATGQFLGVRDVLQQPGTGLWQGLPAGTVASSSAVRTAVVPALGAEPR